MEAQLPHTLCSFKAKYLSHEKSFFVCVCVYAPKHILLYPGEESDRGAPWVMEKLFG